jgi:hypothetical protein
MLEPREGRGEPVFVFTGAGPVPLGAAILRCAMEQEIEGRARWGGENSDLVIAQSRNCGELKTMMIVVALIYNVRAGAPGPKKPMAPEQRIRGVRSRERDRLWITCLRLPT